MKIISFTANDTQKYKLLIVGTAIVELGGQTRELSANQTINDDGSIRVTTVNGIAMRYPTGKKIWDGFATVHPGGHVNYYAGYDGQIRRGAPIVIGFFDKV